MDINEILSVVFALVIVVISRYLIPYLKTRLEKEGQEKLVELIEALVQAAEQIYTGVKQGEQKKKYVVKALAADGVEITESVNAMIESAVYSLDK